MKIRTKLTLLFTTIIAALLLVFSLFIYYAYADNREEEYFRRLRQQAITKAELLLDAKVAPDVLQLIYKNKPNSLFQEEVALYDTAFHLLYHDAVDIDVVKETRAVIDEIRRKKEIRFYQAPLQVVGFLFAHGGRQYVITAAARDEYGLAKLENLRFTLIIAFLVSTVFIFLAGYFFSRQALKPVSEMVGKVEEITATRLELRVRAGKGRDEITELATTFNRMLDRLEHSFSAQKEFVANISHELRTPLAAIVAELDLAGGKEKTPEEYQSVINRTLGDARKLVKLSNGLLDLAKASYDPSGITFRNLRLDELLLDARQEVLRQNPQFKVSMHFAQELENDAEVTIRGNEYLLKVAFLNLMDNACKFSADQYCKVSITTREDRSVLRFEDNGIGIQAEELPHIFNSFYRGHNGQYAAGNGIGLSLVQKIVALHLGEIKVSSPGQQGTLVTVALPHI